MSTSGRKFQLIFKQYISHIEPFLQITFNFLNFLSIIDSISIKWYNGVEIEYRSNIGGL